jgi:hypothetical protein
MYNNKNELGKEFLRRFLPDESLQKIDLETIEQIKRSFLDPNYISFMHDIVFGFIINGKRGYLYTALEYGGNISQQLYDIIIEEAKLKLIKWHNQKNLENQNPEILIPTTHLKCKLKEGADLSTIPIWNQD